MRGMRVRLTPLLAASSHVITRFVTAGSAIPSMLVTLAFCANAVIAHAEAPTIFKWVDENGIAHYTTDRDRIPSAIRDRVESVATKSKSGAPAVAGQPSREDVMRDAVRTTPNPSAIAPPAAASAPRAPAPEVATIAAPSAAPAPAPIPAPAATPADTEDTEEQVATEPEAAPPIEPTEIASPAPFEAAPSDESPAVSAAPPAAAIELEPKEQAAVTELDQQIEAVQAEIAQREETLAALISTSDEDRTTPLVDDPAFREISQRLPKLQADLQTLRERRNKIQPTASTP